MLFVATRTIKKCILNEYGPACGYSKKSLVKNTLTIISSCDENISLLCSEVVFDYSYRKHLPGQNWLCQKLNCRLRDVTLFECRIKVCEVYYEARLIP